MFVYTDYACATLYINSQDNAFIAQSVSALRNRKVCKT
ncbi:hypothetical protein TSAR_003928 [Trichomalopsis sarcophagae]|uniref:Uncharacterized protein n=1 Tax=Trichomalopsis sarcophagae TaxID=543379 RepID=A0A232EZ44_9HYME|nr:hypothetical protein TSAR_003928 [Trichomalopsis sarcophagae]